MRFYRVLMPNWYFDQHHAGYGYEWFTSRVEARRATTVWKRDQREADKLAGEYNKDAGVDVEVIEITPTKKGILAALNEHARHDVTEE
jgi:hypothetical protein